jgi:hypothetical protein
MDLNPIRRLEPKLTGFLDLFHDCYLRKDTRAHLNLTSYSVCSPSPENTESATP